MLAPNPTEAGPAWLLSQPWENRSRGRTQRLYRKSRPQVVAGPKTGTTQRDDSGWAAGAKTGGSSGLEHENTSAIPNVAGSRCAYVKEVSCVCYRFWVLDLILGSERGRIWIIDRF